MTERVSVIGAAQDAADHARGLLFPLRIDVWFTLGLLAFLDQCGRGGGFGSQLPVDSGRMGGVDRDRAGEEIDALIQWLSGNLQEVVWVAALSLTLVTVLLAAVLWINTRGIFMYLDAVATGRIGVVRPWREHRENAGSLFLWRFALTLLTLLTFLACAAVSLVLLYRGGAGPVVPDFAAIGVPLLATVMVFLAVAIAGGLASVALRDFVAPIQMSRGIACHDAIRVVFGLFTQMPGVFFVYVLLKIVFVFGLVISWMVIGCFTCCIGLLPVIGQTIVQPALVFERAWSLYLLRRLGCDCFPAPTGPANGAFVVPQIEPG